ncbi:MAG: cation:proton antiporter [Geminicoccaceae bacterium]
MKELIAFSPYEAGLLALGLCLLLAVWLPVTLFKRYVTLPLVPILGGMALFWFLPDAPILDPFSEDKLSAWERLTEAVVVISLVGAGLKIDSRHLLLTQPIRRLLLVAMPLCISAVALLGWGLAELSWPAALLLGAALAPTDPVLAGDLQVDGPGKGDAHGVRFTLTAEAGLNDGLAFPFVYLAIAAASLGLADLSWLGWWLLRDGLYRIAVGVIVGAGVGWLLAQLVYRAPHDQPVASAGLACIALCVFLIAYGAAELAGGYGFIAAFVSALVLRGAAQDHDYNGVLFNFVEEVEHAATVLVLFLLGGVALLVLPHLTWGGAAVALGLVLVIRPLSGWIALAGLGWDPRDRLAAAFYGIRGIGSLYYLAYGLGSTGFAQPEKLWAIVVVTILLSSTIHGLTASFVMRRLSKSGEGMV